MRFPLCSVIVFDLILALVEPLLVWKTELGVEATRLAVGLCPCRPRPAPVWTGSPPLGPRAGTTLPHRIRCCNAKPRPARGEQSRVWSVADSALPAPAGDAPGCWGLLVAYRPTWPIGPYRAQHRQDAAPEQLCAPAAFAVCRRREGTAQHRPAHLSQRHAVTLYGNGRAAASRCALGRASMRSGDGMHAGARAQPGP